MKLADSVFCVYLSKEIMLIESIICKLGLWTFKTTTIVSSWLAVEEEGFGRAVGANIPSSFWISSLLAVRFCKPPSIG